LCKFQALETLKVLGQFGEPLVQRLLLFDASACQFRTVKIRGQRANCVACSENSTLTKENICDFQYSEFCGNAPAHDKHVPDGAAGDILPSISCQQYQQMHQSNLPHVLLDVRDGVQFEMCALLHALNIPLKQLPERLADLQARIDDLKLNHAASEPCVVVVCRRGVNSKAATRLLIEHGFANVLNLSGGLNAWHTIDSGFPLY
jgi:adenylyltransferase/sulfurtransferase